MPSTFVGRPVSCFFMSFLFILLYSKICGLKQCNYTAEEIALYIIETEMNIADQRYLFNDTPQPEEEENEDE